MKLHLLRHAKTEVLLPGSTDFMRKLLPKGIVQANVAGQYMADHSVSFKETYCSDAERTRQTLQVISTFVETGKVHFRKDLYLADRDTYLNLIWSLAHNKEILIVGHNDGISELATYLTGERINMKTCAYVCITFSTDSWNETSVGTGTISALFRPEVCFPD